MRIVNIAKIWDGLSLLLKYMGLMYLINEKIHLQLHNLLRESKHEMRVSAIRKHSHSIVSLISISYHALALGNSYVRLVQKQSSVFRLKPNQNFC